MPESIKTRLMRYGFNLAPVYRGTGGRVTYIAADWREVRVRVPLSWRTRNYVGTMFGGSMFGAVDPFYMIMLMQNLGNGYVVWDKAARIEFRKPGRSTLEAVFLLDEAELDAIRDALQASPAVERSYPIELRDRDGVLCAVVTKTVHVRAKGSGRLAGNPNVSSRA